MSLPDIRKERNNYQHYPITDKNTALSYNAAETEAYSETYSPAFPKSREKTRKERSERYERRNTMLNTALWGLYIFAIGGAAFNAVFKKSTYEITSNHGKFAARPSNSVIDYVPEGATTPYSPLAKGETHTQVALNEFQMTDTLTFDDVYQGSLLLVDEEHPLKDTGKADTIRVSDTMNGYYALISQEVRLAPEAVEALNEMMEAYGNLNGYGDFVVYGTTDTFTGEGSCCPEYFPESQTGYTVDLAVSLGGLLPYDGEDSQRWIVDHCAEYGFIVRYPQNKSMTTGKDYIPWHLRYVGKVHAAAMIKNNLCFEEYLSFIKRYTFDAPLVVTVGDTMYHVFYTKAEKEGQTHVQRLLDGGYEVSGNNTDGFIATIWKNE